MGAWLGASWITAGAPEPRLTRPADMRLMGSRPPGSQAEAAASAVSPLWIAGSVFTPGAGSPNREAAALETIGQTAIDRVRGAAASGPLRFSRMAAAAERSPSTCGTTGRLPLDRRDLELIAAGSPRSAATGPRAAAGPLDPAQHGTVDPATPDGAGPGLAQRARPVRNRRHPHDPRDGPDGRPWLADRFAIVDGLLTSDGQPGKPARTRQRQGKPLIPGSHGKGSSGPGPSTSSGPGTASRPPARSSPAAETARLRHLRPPRPAGQARVPRLLHREVPATPPVRTHVGIDRVSGGVARRPAVPDPAAARGQLHLQIDALGDVARLGPQPHPARVRDIDDGLIGVGSRTTRGLGALRLTSPSEDPQPVRVPALEEAVPTEAIR